MSITETAKSAFRRLVSTELGIEVEHPVESLEGDRTQEMIDWIGHLPVPTILVERQPQRWTPTPRQIEWVRSDHALGLEIAVHHLHEHGHRRMGLLLSAGSPTSDYLDREWHVACADLGLSDAMVVRESVAPGHARPPAHHR
jgi:DNA-binding LacI/PurR family transcriptional regulator